MDNIINKKNNKDERVDVLENSLHKLNGDILETLLLDRTTNKNILWCTDNYNKYGVGYNHDDAIEIYAITGKRGNIIKPRTKKTSLEKKQRIKEKAEVFTPSWACNHQNNLIDNIWFNDENIFNFEKNDEWIVNKDKIKFNNNKTWKDYVLDLRLEITCGEAPYVVSRYDTVTGEIIDPINRIGIIDRKIRVINENTNNLDEWYRWVIKAYQSVYGYEWQGDSLLIARENLLYSFIDYYEERFNEMPPINKIKEISEIISWNFWQMDGLKGVIPNSCNNQKFVQYDLFGEPMTTKCYGCENHKINEHNGIYCKVRDWEKNKSLKYIDLLPKGV